MEEVYHLKAVMASTMASNAVVCVRKRVKNGQERKGETLEKGKEKDKQG